MDAVEIQRRLTNRTVDLFQWGGEKTLLDALSILHDLPRSVGTIKRTPGIVVEEAVMRGIKDFAIPLEDAERFLRENFPALGKFRAHYIATEAYREERQWQT